MDDDPARFDDVTSLGVDEHIWHHVDERKRGPKALTGLVDLSRDQAGRTRARLLDLVPGRSGKAYADWLDARGDAFRKRVQVATLDPFHGYKNAIDDQLEDATSQRRDADRRHLPTSSDTRARGPRRRSTGRSCGPS